MFLKVNKWWRNFILGWTVLLRQLMQLCCISVNAYKYKSAFQYVSICCCCCCCAPFSGLYLWETNTAPCKLPQRSLPDLDHQSTSCEWQMKTCVTQAGLGKITLVWRPKQKQQRHVITLSYHNSSKRPTEGEPNLFITCHPS